MNFKTNTQTKQSGFTIVELLVVIVVIGILAAITLVAYNGIQDRAMTTSGQQLASSVAKKAEVYYTLRGMYPLDASSFAETPESAVDNPSSIKLIIWNTEHADGGKAVVYESTYARDGACIGWWDYTAAANGEPPLQYIKLGVGDVNCV